MYERLRAKFGYAPDLPDSDVVKRVKAEHYPTADPKTFARAISKFEAGQRATRPAPNVPRETPSPIESTITESAAHIPGIPSPVGRFIANLGIEQAKDVGATAQSMARGMVPGGVPAVNMATDAAVHPERGKRAVAFSAGMMAPVPGAGAAARLGAGPLARVLAGGGAGGLADSAIRSGGDLASMIGGTAFGMAGGGLLHGLLPHATPASGGFAKAFPKEFALVKMGKLDPGEAILKALGPGTIPEDATFEGMKSALAKEAGIGPKPEAQVQQGRMENPLRSVEERTKAAGEPGKAIVDLFHKADDEGTIRAGLVNRELRSAGLNKQSLKSKIPFLGRSARAAEDRGNEITHDLAIGKLKPEDVKPEDRTVFDVWDKYRKTPVPRARAAGMKARTDAGEMRDIGEQQNYFPTDTPHANELRDVPFFGNRKRADVIRNAVRNRGYSDEAEAARALDDWRAFQKSGGGKGGDVYAASRVKRGLADSIEQAKGQMLKFAKSAGQKRSSNLEYAKEFDHDFYDPNPGRALPRYAENVEGRIADAENFGADLEKLAAHADQLTDPHQRQALGKLIDTLRGAGNDLSPTTGGKLIRGGRMAAALKIANPLSAVRNLSQGLNTLTSTDLGSTVGGYIRSATRKGKDFAIESGAVSERSLHNSHSSIGSEGALDKLLTLGGFKPAEMVNRSGAANAHLLYARKMAKNLLKNPSNSFAASERRLHVDPAEVLLNNGLSDMHGRLAGKVGTDLTQFRQRPMDLPAVMTEHPIGRLLTQFKGFAFQQGRFLAQETLDRFRSGNPTQVRRGLRNVALLATAFPLTGEGLNQLRAVVTGKQSDTGALEDWLSEIKDGLASSDPEDKLDAVKTFAQRYGEDFAQTGGIGLSADILQSLKYDNLLGWIVGPALQTGANVAQTGYHAATGKDVSGYEKRKLLREIPLVGPLAANRVYPSEEP